MGKTNRYNSCYEVAAKAAGLVISPSIIGGSGVILANVIEKNNAGESDSTEQALVISAAAGYMSAHSYNFAVGVRQCVSEHFKPSPISQQVANGALASSSVLFFCNNLRNLEASPDTPVAAGIASLTVPICFFSASVLKARLTHTKDASAFGLSGNTAKKMIAGCIAGGGAVFMALSAFNENVTLGVFCGVLAAAGTTLGIASHQAEKAKPKIHPFEDDTVHASPRGDLGGLGIA